MDREFKAIVSRNDAVQQQCYEIRTATDGFAASPLASRRIFRNRCEARQFLLQLGSSQRLPIALSALHSGQRINAIADDLCVGRLRVIVHQLPVQAVTVELDATDAARQSLLKKTQATLQKIIAEQDRETRVIAKAYDEKSVLGKAGMHAEGMAEGFVETGAAFLTWVGDVHDVVDMQKRMMRGASAAMQSYRGPDFSFGDFQGRMIQAEYKEIVEVLGFDPYKIDPEAIVQAFETTKLVLQDEQMVALAEAFAYRYVAAQHSTEYTGIIGNVIFEIVLTAVLIFLTAGAGVAATAGSKLKNVDALKDLGRCFDDFVKLIKKKQAKQLDTDSGQQTAIGKADIVEQEDVDVSPSNPNDAKTVRTDQIGSDEVVAPDKSLSENNGVSNDKTPKEMVDELTPEELELVNDVSTFKTNGVSNQDAENWLINHPDGQEYFEILRASIQDDIPDEQVLSWATDHVKSGASLPEKISVDESLVKIIPKGNNISGSQNSPFLTTREELLKAQNSDKGMWDSFGLPMKSDAFEYDVYELPPKEGATGFLSKIAPTEELGGRFKTNAGSNQVLLPSKDSFGTFERVGSVGG
ncbi:hypothetical protein SIN8267_02533 [Sinobacterium norvegicum]|uniref:Uncharacterized protein n=1 Tax=Sinobacterium norvegicum TaxID=1641715 RepID=A0ABN8EIZ9_9GAMM|nr:hypothetical protein [Sinobacterium norvegicum]CAH0992413.1 hypothetical protein SIN8267_02533 [Sinobacterium norvegicum]